MKEASSYVSLSLWEGRSLRLMDDSEQTQMA